MDLLLSFFYSRAVYIVLAVKVWGTAKKRRLSKDVMVREILNRGGNFNRIPLNTVGV